MNGFDLAAKIRAMEESFHAAGTMGEDLKHAPVRIPIIMLCSSGNRGDSNTCMDIGIDGYLTRPITREHVRRAIEAVFNNREAGKTNQRLVTKHSLSEESEKEIASPSAMDSRKDIRILLVEDYPTNQQVALRHLRSAGYHVELAEEGQQAVDAFKRNPFNLILMDIQMPVMDGYQATRLIRDLELEIRGRTVEGEKSLAGTSEYRTPIIAMTAHAIKGYREKCLNSGMDDYITKPMKRKDLLAIVEKWTAAVSVARSETCGPESTIDKKAPMDYESALDEFEHDEAFLKEVLRGFLEAVGNQINIIHQAIADSDAETVRRESHSIKGGAANLTAKDLSGAAFALEMLGKSGALKGAGETLDNVKKEFQRLAAYAGEKIT
jgi:CheY-like chemotaxis protein/HPt (histidine-containing phosphotransfer) domain-containing protein